MQICPAINAMVEGEKFMPLDWSLEDSLKDIIEMDRKGWSITWLSLDLILDTTKFRDVLTEVGICRTFNMISQDELLKTEEYVDIKLDM